MAGGLPSQWAHSLLLEPHRIAWSGLQRSVFAAADHLSRSLQQRACSLMGVRPAEAATCHSASLLSTALTVSAAKDGRQCIPTTGFESSTPLLQAELAAFKKDREGDQGRLKALTKELHDLQARSKDRQAALDREVGIPALCRGHGGHWQAAQCSDTSESAQHLRLSPWLGWCCCPSDWGILHH